MRFHFSLANLNEGGLIRTEDVTKWFLGGMKEAGHRVSLGVTDVNPSAINVFYENFEDHAFSLLREMRKRRVPWGIVCTERITGNSFNNMTDPTKFCGPKYTWRDRFENFTRAARMADFIWCLDPGSYEVCKAELNPNTFLIRAGYTKGLVELTPRPEAEKDIDFLFFGAVTPYRKNIIHQIEARGHKVVYNEAFVPTYLRNDLVERARINLSLLMNEKWLIPSLSRLTFLISNSCPVVCEAVPTEPEIEKYATTVPSAVYVDQCISLLESGEIVVSLSCAGFISPNPLNRWICIFSFFFRLVIRLTILFFSDSG